MADYPLVETDPISQPGLDATNANLDAEIAARIAAVALKQDAATAATDTELAAEASTRAAADALKQDAATAATDAELATEAAARAAADALKLTAASNLSDLVSANTARTNLGLGTAATKDAGAAGQAGKVLNADDATTTNSRAPTAHKTSHAVGGSDALVPSDLGEFFDTRRSSECTTMPRLLASTSITPVSGSMYGVLAVARSAFTATQMRVMVGTAFASLTDFRLCVWKLSDRTLLKSTAAEHVAVNAFGANNPLTLALTSSLAVALGDQLIIGLAAVGQSAGTLRGTVSIGSQMSIAPQLSWSATGYTVGVPGTISTGGSGLLPWVELLA